MTLLVWTGSHLCNATERKGYFTKVRFSDAGTYSLKRSHSLILPRGGLQTTIRMNVRNYIHLTGNLGADPTTFVLPSGDLSCKFSLATNDYYRSKEGERVTTTEWHVVRAYGKLAGLFAEHLAKGSQISVVGSMRYRKWEDKFGQSRISPEVIAREFTFLSPKKSSDDQPTRGAEETTIVDVLDADIEDMMLTDATDTAAANVAPRPKKKTATRRGKSKPVHEPAGNAA